MRCLCCWVVVRIQAQEDRLSKLHQSSIEAKVRTHKRAVVAEQKKHAKAVEKQTKKYEEEKKELQKQRSEKLKLKRQKKSLRNRKMKRREVSAIKASENLQEDEFYTKLFKLQPDLDEEREFTADGVTISYWKLLGAIRDVSTATPLQLLLHPIAVVTLIRQDNWSMLYLCGGTGRLEVCFRPRRPGLWKMLANDSILRT